MHLHGIHSPLVFELQQNLKAEKNIPTQLIKYRKTLLNSKQLLHLDDYGAGAFWGTSARRCVREIAITSGSSLKKQQELVSIVRYFKPNSILELGTNLGLGTSALASAHDSVKIDSVDADAALVAFTRQHLTDFGFDNINIQNATFEAFLKQKTQTYDLIFLDGHHDHEASIRYVETLKYFIHSNSLIIIDDIRWSLGMYHAWKSIVNDPFWKLSIDFGPYGIVQRQENRKKQHFFVKI